MKRALLLLFPLLACQSGLAQDRVDGANISLNALKEIRTALGNFYPVDPENPIRHLPSESRGELSLYYKFPESKTVVEIPNFRSKHHEVSRRREGNASITRYRIEWIPMANRKRSLPTSRLTVKVGVGAPRNLRPEEYRGETRSRDDAEREYQQAFAEGLPLGTGFPIHRQSCQLVSASPRRAAWIAIDLRFFHRQDQPPRLGLGPDGE